MAILFGLVAALSLIGIIVIISRSRKTSKANEKQRKEALSNLFVKSEMENATKKTITCENCGSSIDVFDGNGKCPYCGAKIVKK